MALATKRQYGGVLILTIVFAQSCSTDTSKKKVAEEKSMASTAALNKAVVAAKSNSASTEPQRMNGLIFYEAIRGHAKPSDELPLVVSLHGQGDKPDTSQFPEFGFPVRVVWPQAPTRYEDGYQWFPFHTMERPTPTLVEDIENAVTRVSGFVEEYKKHRPTRGLPVWVGFSQGGMIALAQASSHPERVAAVHPISSDLPGKLRPSLSEIDERAKTDRLPRIRALHGIADAIVAIAPMRTTVETFRSSGYDVSLREFKGVGHELTPEMGDMLARELVESVRAAQSY